MAKHRAEIEAARKDREKIETNNRFLEHDLAQEAERARNTRRTLRDRQANMALSKDKASPATTPKRNRILPYRDGFNDEEAVMLSPSKLKEKAKTTSPKAGAKRKRAPSQKSPSQHASFSEPIVQLESVPSPVPEAEPALPPYVQPSESGLQQKLEVSRRTMDILRIMLTLSSL